MDFFFLSILVSRLPQIIAILLPFWCLGAGFVICHPVKLDWAGLDCRLQMIVIDSRPCNLCRKSSVSISLIGFINTFRSVFVCIHYCPILKSDSILAVGANS
jgi:hypothetical protein